MIVDDLSDYSQPFFQDGLEVQAVNYVVEQGVAYFTSADNLGRHAWEAPEGFVTSGQPFIYLTTARNTVPHTCSDTTLIVSPKSF